jgi:hypothetical protein
VLGLGLAACGGSNGDAASQTASNHAPSHRTKANGSASTATATNFSTRNNDRDNDGDHNDDDAEVLEYGHTANATDRRVSVTLVKRYYAAAAAEDGAKGCSMLAPFIAESIVENDGQAEELRGRSCATVMHKLFKLHHRRLAEKNATLKILDVRVDGNKALAILEFPFIPEVRKLVERRVGSTWRLLEPLDSILE